MDAHRLCAVRVAFMAAALCALAAPLPARADTVTDWNVHATEALIAKKGFTPPVSAIHLAMVHGAVYDAVEAIDRRYQPYLVSPRARRWYSEDSAAATAAYRVLLGIVPEQQQALDGYYAASLAAIPPGPARDGGIAVGDAAAAAMLAARANDGRFGPFRFTAGTQPGQWRPELPAFVSDPNAWVKDVKPFLIRDPADFQSRGPHALTSRAYAREFDEVKALGARTGSTRTADQTDIALFWSGHTLDMWSRIFRTLSAEHGLSVADDARFYAMLYLTEADAGIACWTDKAHWMFWRPITAIRQADTDGNPATTADPAWLPLIDTPPYPDHPSGHNCVSGSTVRTLRDFFGTNRVPITATSNAPGHTDLTRSYARLPDVIHEIIEARIYGGLHFRAADEQGARIGFEVAAYRQAHFFHPRPWRWHSR